jgi:hypothetical protein
MMVEGCGLDSSGSGLETVTLVNTITPLQSPLKSLQCGISPHDSPCAMYTMVPPKASFNRLWRGMVKSSKDKSAKIL